MGLLNFSFKVKANVSYLVNVPDKSPYDLEGPTQKAAETGISRTF